MNVSRLPPRRDLPMLLDRVLPGLRALLRAGYFSLDVEGAEHIPREGSALYVANRAGWLPLDALFGALAVVHHAGPDRLPYGAVPDEVLALPRVGRLLERLGGFPASWLGEPAALPPAMSLLSLHPESGAGGGKPFWQAYQMKRWRLGFARVAAARAAPVVPVAIVGGEECLPVASTVRFLEPLLGSVLPLPLCALPLPARWKIVFHAAVRVEEPDPGEAGDDRDAQRRRYRRFTDAVQATVQRTLDRETEGHRLVRMGRLFSAAVKESDPLGSRSFRDVPRSADDPRA